MEKKSLLDGNEWDRGACGRGGAAKKKARPFLFLNMDYKAVQRWLEREAEDGWELMEIKQGWGTAVFRKTNRADLRWCVDLACGRDDPDYLRLCVDAGWMRVARVGNLNLFKSAPGRDPVPIQTDRDIERERFGRIFFGGRLLWLLALLMVAYLVFEAVLFAKDGFWPHDLAFSYIWQMFLFQAAVMAAMAVYLICLAFYWRRVCHSAAAGGEMPVPSLFWARVRGALIWVLYGLFLALALYTSYGGALSDGRESWEADGFHFQTESTFLGSHAEASDSVDRSGWVMVDVFDCRFSWLADLVVRDLLAEEGRSPEPMGHLHSGGLKLEALDLGLDAAWIGRAPPAFDGGRDIQCLVVRRENRVLRLCGDWDFTTPDSRVKIREALGLA